MVPQGDALMGWGNQGPSAQERTACHERKLAHFRPTLIHDPGSILRRPVRPYTLRWAGKSLRDLVSLLHTFDGLAQCAKLPSEIGQLVMGVQAAGVRQHPDDRALQRLRLAAEFCEPV